MHEQGSNDQLVAGNALWKRKVVQMMRLWSKEYLNLSFNCTNDVTIPCNVSMMMIALSKWVLVYIDVTNSGKYLNFIKFWKCFGDGCRNETVICIQTYQVFGWLKLMFQVDYFEHGSER